MYGSINRNPLLYTRVLSQRDEEKRYRRKVNIKKLLREKEMILGLDYGTTTRNFYKTFIFLIDIFLKILLNYKSNMEFFKNIRNHFVSVLRKVFKIDF